MLHAKFASAGSWLRRWLQAVLCPKGPGPAQGDPALRDVERLTRDIDAAMADMRLLTRPNSGPDCLMPTRLELLGLDADYLRSAHPGTYQAMRSTCAACPSWRACARDLARGNATRGLASYCRNAERIDALIVER